MNSWTDLKRRFVFLLLPLCFLFCFWSRVLSLLFGPSRGILTCNFGLSAQNWSQASLFGYSTQPPRMCTVVKMESGNVVSLSQQPSQPMSQSTGPRQGNSYQTMANISRTAQDDEMSTQDGFSYSSSLQSSHDMDHWTLSAPGSMESSPVMPQPKTPEVQMLPYSFPHQSMLPSGGLPDSTGMFPSLSDLHAGGASEMEYAQPGQDFSQAFSSMVDFPFDESQSCMNDDCASMGNSALHEDGSWKMSLDNGDFPTTTYESVTAGTTAPVSPPLTEASNVSMASGPAYTLPGHDETIRGEKDSGTVRGPTLSMEESAHPLTPPLNDQDPNKFVLHSLRIYSISVDH